MKRLILLIFVAVFSTALFAQGEASFGLATKYQSKLPTSEWGEWKSLNEPMLIYMDLGFGFVAMENGYNDRFILNKESTTKTYDAPDKTVFSVKAIDNQGKQCTLKFVYFAGGDFALIAEYGDMHYTYWCDGEHGAHGYPYKYFNSSPPQSTPSPKVKGSLGVKI